MTSQHKAPLEIREKIIEDTLAAGQLRSQRMELIVHILLASKNAAQFLKRPLQAAIQTHQAILGSDASDDGTGYEKPLWVDTICKL